ncbi:MAG: hypothetical protein H8E90_06200 [Anaerolineales bacterium]|nr:hypothetical protein [Anaerolineales bacterium]
MPVKRLAVLIDADLHRRFKALVSTKGLDMSEVARELIERWVKENELFAAGQSPTQPYSNLQTDRLSKETIAALKLATDEKVFHALLELLHGQD